MGAVIEPKDDDVEPRIDELARALADAINREEASGRTDMRDRAIEVLRDTVETAPAGSAGEGGEEEDAEAGRALNPFALGIPLLLVGPFLAFLFPPVGIILVLLGLVACAAGVGLAIVRSTAARFRGGARGEDRSGGER